MPIKSPEAVKLAITVTRRLRENATDSANKQGVSIRQAVITFCECLINGETDLTISEVIDRAKSKSDDRRWKNKIN